MGGASFARAWNAAWKGKVTVVSVFGRALPSGTDQDYDHAAKHVLLKCWRPR